MNVENKVRLVLKDINLQLKEQGIKSIVLSTKLLYGKDPTERQIRQVINNTQISFLASSTSNE